MADRLRALGVAVAIPFRADRRRSVAVLVLTVVGSLVVVAVPYWLKRIIDAVGQDDATAATTAAVGVGLTTGLGMLARGAAARLQFPLKEHTGLYLDRRIIELVTGIAGVEHLERPEYLDRLEVLRREASILGFAGIHIATAVALAAQIGATGLLLATVNPLLLAVPLFAVASFWSGRRAEAIRQAALDQTAVRYRLARYLFGVATAPAAGKELRVYGLGDELLGRHRRVWDEIDRIADAAAIRGLAWTTAGWVVFTAGYGSAIALVVSQAVSGRAGLGDVVLALALVAQINRQVSLAVSIVGTAARMARVADRLMWLDRYSCARRADLEHLPAPAVLTSGIELRGVSFRYPDTDVDVLDGLDLFIPAGATVAVVGNNGAGKSTLVKLLCRFYDRTGGTITVDGTDLARIDVDEWRQRIAAGFQDFARLELVARQSIGVGDLPAVDDELAVAAALEKAGAADMTGALPLGLETHLGPSFGDGADLSGGQWQKLALARAMMRRHPLLLILDEPTAALDAAAEHRLFQRYTATAAKLAALNGAITLVVSHRFSTVRVADLIVVVDDGKVIEAGTHDELMAAGGLYRELYDLQARAYR